MISCMFIGIVCWTECLYLAPARKTRSIENTNVFSCGILISRIIVFRFISDTLFDDDHSFCITFPNMKCGLFFIDFRIKFGFISSVFVDGFPIRTQILRNLQCCLYFESVCIVLPFIKIDLSCFPFSFSVLVLALIVDDLGIDVGSIWHPFAIKIHIFRYLVFLYNFGIMFLSIVSSNFASSHFASQT